VSFPALLLAGLLRIYQWTVRPLIGSNCRFHPSCSDYAIEALTTHGAWLGALIAGRRVLRCNPWVAGGYDPVPADDRARTVSKARAAH